MDEDTLKLSIEKTNNEKGPLSASLIEHQADKRTYFRVWIHLS